MKSTTVCAVGQLPHHLVLDVAKDTFEDVMQLADAGNRPSQLREAVIQAEAALDRDDEDALDTHLRAVIAGAAAVRVRMRCSDECPDAPPQEV